VSPTFRCRVAIILLDYQAACAAISQAFIEADLIKINVHGRLMLGGVTRQRSAWISPQLPMRSGATRSVLKVRVNKRKIQAYFTNRLVRRQ
jgi:hypothetical protein